MNHETQEVANKEETAETTVSQDNTTQETQEEGVRETGLADAAGIPATDEKAPESSSDTVETESAA